MFQEIIMHYTILVCYYFDTQVTSKFAVRKLVNIISNSYTNCSSTFGSVLL